jgi:hypothetical protein
MPLSSIRTIKVSSGVMRWPQAEPDDFLDYSLDVTEELNDVLDTIVSATVRIKPSGRNELQASEFIVVGNKLTLFLTGGYPGRQYIVRFEAPTTGGRKFDWPVILNVDSLLADRKVQPDPASNDFGSPVTATVSSLLDMRNSSNSFLRMLGWG